MSHFLELHHSKEIFTQKKELIVIDFGYVAR